MPRKNLEEVVYVLLDMGGITNFPYRIDVYGTRTEAENEAERIARAAGWSTHECKFDAYGELQALNRKNRLDGTGIFVKSRTIKRKTRVLKGKSDAQA